MSEKKYFTGFRGNEQVIYGKNHTGDPLTIQDGGVKYAEPMTLVQARKSIEIWKKKNAWAIEEDYPVVFEAVEVKA